MRTERLLAVAAFLAAAAAPAQAQVPAGSYQQSCSGITVANNVLHAQCKSMSGASVGTTLQLPCNGKIDNINGKLTCSGAPAAGVPQGSYLQSCADARVQDNTLHAKCRRANQTVADASLKLPCTGKIDNLNGVLTCVGGAVTPPPPPPPKTVTLVVTHPGNAVGGVKGTGGIYSTCRPKCEKTYDFGTDVTLEVDASGNRDVTFDRWDGACAGQGTTCKIKMDANKSTALYMKVTQGYIDVNFKGVGAEGPVKPVGQVGPNGVMRRYTAGTKLTLEGGDDPLHGVTFKQWGGACASAGTNKACTVTIDKPLAIEAHFNQGPTHLLTVTNPSQAVGGVQGTGGIYSTCRPKCEVRLAKGTNVTLEVNTSGDNTVVLDRWEGACKGQGNKCTFVLDGDKSVQQYMKKK